MREALPGARLVVKAWASPSGCAPPPRPTGGSGWARPRWGGVWARTSSHCHLR